MDRDLAIQIVAKITSINTSLAAIATNTTPADSSAKSISMPADLRGEPEPEPETRSTKSTKK